MKTKMEKKKIKRKEKQEKSPNRVDPHRAGVCGAVQVPTLSYMGTVLFDGSAYSLP
jgi:hypothetical protein